MGWWEDFTTWVTGRNGIYEDEDKVESVKQDLNAVKIQIENEKENLQQAVNKLNNIKGMAEHVGTINSAAFDGLFDVADDAVDAIIGLINGKVADIEEYNNSAWWEKAGSTTTMIFAKAGEGILSVGEGVLDAGATVIGGGTTWLLGRGAKLVGWDSAASVLNSAHESVSDFVKTDLSHEAFSFYYDSDLAKASAITENSGAAMIAEGVGAAGGYLALGGFVSGLASASKVAGTGSKAINILAGTSTRANTTVSVVAGMGSGTQTSLQNGSTLGEAALSGIKQGAIQGGLAYGVGKLGEYVQKQAAVKTAKETFNSADDAVNKASAALTDPELTPAMADLAKNNFDDALIARASASKTLTNVQNAKLSTFDGYSDAISNTFKKREESVFENGLKSTAVADATAIGSALKSGGTKLAGIATHPVQSAKDVLKTATKPVSATYNAAKNTAINVYSHGVSEGLKISARSAATGASNIASNAINTLGTVTGTVGTTTSLKTAAATAARVAVPTAVGSQIASDAANAAQQFESKNLVNNIMADAQNNNPTPTVAADVLDPNANNTQQPQNQTTQGTTGSTGGNSNSGGYVPVTPSGGSNTMISTPSTQSTTQPSVSTTTPTADPTTQTTTTETPPSTIQNRVETPVTDTNSTPTVDSPTGTDSNNTVITTPTNDNDTSISEPPTIDNNDNISEQPSIQQQPQQNQGASVEPPVNNSNNTIRYTPQNQTTNTTSSNGSEITTIPEESVDGSDTISNSNDGFLSNDGEDIDIISIDKTTPNATSSVSTTSKSSGTNAIPIILGVAAAGGAAVAGAKYIKNKKEKENDNGEEDNYYYEDNDLLKSDPNDTTYENFTPTSEGNDAMQLIMGSDNQDSKNLRIQPESESADFNINNTYAKDKYQAGSMNKLNLEDGRDIKIEDDVIFGNKKEELE